MSYIDDIAGALAKALNHASDGAPERFAGYAANREFWVGEAAHVLEVIAGYGARYERMKSASEASRPAKYDWPTIPIAERSMSNSDLSKARKLVREAARRFLRRCVKVLPEEQEAIFQGARRLDIPTPL